MHLFVYHQRNNKLLLFRDDIILKSNATFLLEIGIHMQMES